MCGIAGVIHLGDGLRAERSVLEAQGSAIAHRGPDGQGIFLDGPVGLVHRRLAIIDLEGGNQPIGNEDGTIQVVFNGEIYNYESLRADLEQRGHRFRTHSDTEVLVHLYEEYGTEFLPMLRGMFAFALRDSRRRKTLLARDHLGQKPLYIYESGDKFVFGSELKAILAVPGVDRNVAPEAVVSYLTFGVVPGRMSIFQAVKRLPAAHWMLISDDGTRTTKRYWELEFAPDENRSVEDWAAEVEGAITDSVRAHLVADVPVGAFLSGGLDSSAIVAVASELKDTPLQTFSVGFDEKRYSELPYAEQVARQFGTRHLEQIVRPDAVTDLDDLVFYYDEPFADASAIPSLAVARVAAKHVKVVLSGDGGDEAFGGYARYAHDLREAAIRRCLPNFLRRTFIRGAAAVWPHSDRLPRPLRLGSVLQNLSLDPDAAYARTLSACREPLRSQLLRPELRQQTRHHRPETEIAEHYRRGGAETLSGMLAADIRFLLPDDFLTKVDRASMACGLEVRPPLIDVPLMELTARMPAELKVRNGCTKWLLKKIFEPRLPPKLAHRRKQGFDLPVDEWLRGPLRDQAYEVLAAPQSQLSEWIDPARAEQLLRNHASGRSRQGQVLWSLLVLGRWMDRWTRPEPQPSFNAPPAVTADV